MSRFRPIKKARIRMGRSNENFEKCRTSVWRPNIANKISYLEHSKIINLNGYVLSIKS